MEQARADAVAQSVSISWNTCSPSLKGFLEVLYSSYVALGLCDKYVYLISVYPFGLGISAHTLTSIQPP